jgi:hypothetical protein
MEAFAACKRRLGRRERHLRQRLEKGARHFIKEEE